MSVWAIFCPEKMQSMIFGKCASLKRKIRVYKLAKTAKIVLKKRHKAPWESSIVEILFVAWIDLN